MMAAPPEDTLVITLNNLQQDQAQAMKKKMEQALAGVGHLDAAAQAAMTSLREQLGAALVLARLYVVMPARMLNRPLYGWAADVARSKGLGDSLSEDTPTLTLLGTAGAEPEWNSRATSAGHRAVPLLSSAFVAQVPMVTALLHELGLGLSWLDQGSMAFVEKHLGNLMGMFFVPDAATTRDSEGRLIIPAQDFVAAHNVKTVFGLGSSYVGGALAVMIFFTTETLTKAHAERLSLFMSAFKAKTAGLLRKQTVFSDG